MSLTLNQFLFFVITIAVVVAVTFLVTLIIQLRKTAKEGEEALIEVKELAKNLKATDQRINTKIDDIGDTAEATKKAVVSFAEIAAFVAGKLIRPSSKYWPFLFPLLRFGWRHLKKRREDKNGK